MIWSFSISSLPHLIWRRWRQFLLAGSPACRLAPRWFLADLLPALPQQALLDSEREHASPHACRGLNGCVLACSPSLSPGSPRKAERPLRNRVRRHPPATLQRGEHCSASSVSPGSPWKAKRRRNLAYHHPPAMRAAANCVIWSLSYYILTPLACDDLMEFEKNNFTAFRSQVLGLVQTSKKRRHSIGPLVGKCHDHGNSTVIAMGEGTSHSNHGRQVQLQEILHLKIVLSVVVLTWSEVVRSEDYMPCRGPMPSSLVQERCASMKNPYEKSKRHLELACCSSYMP